MEQEDRYEEETEDDEREIEEERDGRGCGGVQKIVLFSTFGFFTKPLYPSRFFVAA